MSKVIFFCFLSVSYCFTQSPNRYIDSISFTELQKHLEIIASDEYEGRETGEKGQKMTAEYLSNEFQKYGLEKAKGLESYYQEFNLYKTTPGGYIANGKEKLEFPKDFLYTGVDTIFDADISFVPINDDNTKGNQKHAALIVQRSKETVRDLFERITKIKEQGFGGVTFLMDDWTQFKEQYSHYFGESKLFIPESNKKKQFFILFIDKKAFTSILAKSKEWKKWVGLSSTNKPKPLEKLDVALIKKVDVIKTENVLAVIPGSDSLLKNEVLVLTAHYDHLGIENGVVYNGADDDGSGTVALLEIAQSFAYAHQNGEGPKRTVLIMPVTAEEKGLLGSKYYSMNPVYPMENTITNLNIDMIGRTDAHHKNPNYVYIIGSDMLSDDLHETNKEAAEELGLVELDYRYNSKEDPNRFYFRSDHYNFVLNGVPSIFYFSGVHEDYHQPTDTVDKIDFNKIEKVTKLVFLTAWKLANAENRPVVNKAP